MELNHHQSHPVQSAVPEKEVVETGHFSLLWNSISGYNDASASAAELIMLQSIIFTRSETSFIQSHFWGQL